MTPGPLLLITFVALWMGIIVGVRLSRWWLALTGLGAIAGLSAALTVLLGGADWEWRSESLVGGEALHFRLDGVSALFLVLLSIVGGAGAVYAREYWSEEQRANVEAARAAGVNLAFFGGNDAFWKTRWQTSIDGSGTAYRTLQYE